MSQLINLPIRFHKKGMVTFTREEIRQLMSVYGEHVSNGTWRDYALDCLPDMAVFSIFLHSHERPAYSVAKVVSKNTKKTVNFTVYDSTRMLKQSQSLLDVLQVFKQNPKKKK